MNTGDQLLLTVLLARQELLLEFEGDVTDSAAFGLRVMTGQFSPDMRNIAPDRPGERRFSRAVGAQDRPVFSAPDLPGCPGEKHPVSPAQRDARKRDEGFVFPVRTRFQRVVILPGF